MSTLSSESWVNILCVYYCNYVVSSTRGRPFIYCVCVYNLHLRLSDCSKRVLYLMGVFIYYMDIEICHSIFESLIHIKGKLAFGNNSQLYRLQIYIDNMADNIM